MSGFGSTAMALELTLGMVQKQQQQQQQQQQWSTSRPRNGMTQLKAKSAMTTGQNSKTALELGMPGC